MWNLESLLYSKTIGKGESCKTQVKAIAEIIKKDGTNGHTEEVDSIGLADSERGMSEMRAQGTRMFEIKPNAVMNILSLSVNVVAYGYVQWGERVILIVYFRHNWTYRFGDSSRWWKSEQYCHPGRYTERLVGNMSKKRMEKLRGDEQE